MVTTSGNLFHIDFGHFLGRRKHFLVNTVYTVYKHVVPTHVHNTHYHCFRVSIGKEHHLYSLQTSFTSWEEGYAMYHFVGMIKQ